jgi:hypothetical protein
MVKPVKFPAGKAEESKLARNQMLPLPSERLVGVGGGMRVPW